MSPKVTESRTTQNTIT